MTIDTEPAFSLVVIDHDWTDEQIGLLLHNFNSGDPLPSNVITDKDPFAIEPWLASGNIWFLGYFEDYDWSGRHILRNMGGGYWKQVNNNTQISWGNLGEGRKIFWEFYVGREPSGDRTAWQMLEYHRKQERAPEANQANAFISLCRIYLKNSDALASEEGNSHFTGDQIRACELEEELLCLCENEPSMELAKNYQVPPGEEKGYVSELGRIQKNQDADNTADTHASFYCSSEDFLELEDLKDNISPSSSDNSSSTFETFDEGFDATALLQELQSGAIPTENRESSFCHTLEPNQVAIKPPLPASRQGDVKELHEGVASNSTHTDQHKVEIATPSSSPLHSNVTLLASGSGESSRLKRPASRSSEGSGSSHGSQGSSAGTGSSPGLGRSPVSRIKRLGKKYCCISPF